MNVKEMAMEGREGEALRLQPWKLRWLGLSGYVAVAVAVAWHLATPLVHRYSYSLLDDFIRDYS